MLSPILLRYLFEAQRYHQNAFPDEGAHATPQRILWRLAFLIATAARKIVLPEMTTLRLPVRLAIQNAKQDHALWMLLPSHCRRGSRSFAISANLFFSTCVTYLKPSKQKRLATISYQML